MVDSDRAAGNASRTANLKRIAAIASGVVAFLASAIAIWQFVFQDDDPALSYTEIILDASSAMSAPFGGSTKLDQAQQAIDTYLRVDLSPRDQLALRRFGGECNSDGATALLVPFAKDNKDTIRRQLLRQTASGKSTLFLAIREAVPDFDATAALPTVQRRVVTFVGSCEACIEDPIQRIDERLKGLPIAPYWKFIGIEMDTDCVALFRQLPGDVQIVNVSNQQQLSMAAADAMQGNPIRNFAPEVVLAVREDPVTLRAGESLLLDLQTADPNMTVAKLSAPVLPDGASFTASEPGSGRVEWTPTRDQVGDHTLVFTAADQEVKTTKKLRVTVLPSPPVPEQVNRPPVFVESGVQDSFTIETGVRLAFAVQAADPDGDAIEITGSRLPEGATFTSLSPTEGRVAWQPARHQVGEHVITVTVTDGVLSVSKDIRISVTPLSTSASTQRLNYPALIRFEFDNKRVTGAAKNRLASLVSDLQSYDGIAAIVITGHTCSIGAVAYNLQLGLRRAEAVKAYLVQAGIPEQSIETRSQGERYPVADNRSPAGRRENRRVDMTAKVVTSD